VGAASERNDVELGTFADSIEFTNENLMVTAVAGYALIPPGDVELDLIAGARWWTIDADLRFSGGALDGALLSDDESWIDPLIGLRGTRSLGDQHFLSGWAVAGGFGANADEMWDVMGAAGYRLGERFWMLAGYRFLSVEFREDAFAYDVEQSGPMLGAVIRF
jgi:hypothetical protein